MKKLFLIQLLAIWCCLNVKAQSYKWIIGGGGYENMSPTANYEKIHHICTDANGNTYVTAITGSVGIHADTFYMAITHNIYPSIPHILLASYDCSGKMRWAKMIEAYNYTYVGGIGYSNGSIYLAGCLSGDHKYIGYDTSISTSNLSSFTLKVDTSGKFDWIRFIGQDVLTTVSTAYDQGVLGIDKDGNIHNFNYIRSGCPVTASLTTTQAGTYDLKYNPSGNLLSITRLSALDSTWGLINVQYSPTSNKFYASMGPGNKWYYIYSDYEYAVAAFDASDNIIWKDTTVMGSQGFVSKIAYSGGNDIYAAGGGAGGSTYSLGGIASSTSYGGDFGTIYRLDTNGVARWAYDIPSITDLQNMTDITVQPNHHVAATGFYVGKMKNGSDSLTTPSGELNNPYLMILDSSGHLVKLDQLHGPGFDDYGSAIATDRSGNLYLGGCLTSTITGTGLSTYTTYGGNTDFFLVKYGYVCGCTTIPVAGFTSTGTATVTFSYTGSSSYDSLRYYFGDGTSSTTANPIHTYSTPGTYHVCLYVYTDCGKDSFCTDHIVVPTDLSGVHLAQLKVYPNPGTGSFVLENATAGSTVRLLDMTGKEVYKSITNQERWIIDIPALPAGPYLLSITDKEGNRQMTTIMKR